MELSKLEADFIGDLDNDPHELWELYGFIKLHYPDASDSDRVQVGYDLILSWSQRGWLEVYRSREDLTPISADALLSELKNLGTRALYPKPDILILKLTEKARQDIFWLKHS